MRRATVTIPDDLELMLEEYFETKDAPPSLTAVMQAALKSYLLDERLKSRGYIAPTEPFWMEPLVEKDDQGEPDVSINHDAYAGEP